MRKGKIFAFIIIFLIVGAIVTMMGREILSSYETINRLQTQNRELQNKCDRLTEPIQDRQENFIIVDSWIVEDGYSLQEEWLSDYQKYKADYAECDVKFLDTDNAAYATDEQKDKMRELANAIAGSRSVKELKELAKEFDLLAEEVNRQKNEALTQEAVVTTEAYSWTAESNNYDAPSSGLTQQSGINYYDGRTETYYSSNVLHHYRTSEWTVDNEGFYRTGEGYYVVAASDMPQGTTFEGSKGTCIVLDSGCNAGVTDYYVAWS